MQTVRDLTLNPFLQRILSAKVDYNWPRLSGSGEEDENVKHLQTEGQQAIRKAHLSFQVR